MVVGVGRSGTTLLASMLQASSDIFVLPETQILRRIFAQHPVRVAAARFEALLADDANLAKYDVPVSSIISRFHQEHRGADRSSVARLLYDCFVTEMAEAHQQNTGSSPGCVVEKNPTAVDYLPYLRHLYPQVKVVHIARDKHDVVASRMRAGWSAERSPYLHVVAYESQRRAAEADRLRHPDRHFEVRFEDLVSTPTVVATELVRFLGAGDPQDLVNYHERDTAVTASAPWHDSIGQPIDHSKIGRGQGLPDPIRRVCDRAPHDVAERFARLLVDLAGTGHHWGRALQSRAAILADRTWSARDRGRS